MATPKTTRAVPVGRPEKGGGQRRVAVPGGAGKKATAIAKAAPAPVAAGKGKGKKAGQSALAVGRSYAGGVPVPQGGPGEAGGVGADTAVNINLPTPTPTPVAGPRYSSEGDPGGIFDSIVNPQPAGGASIPTLRTVSKPIVGPTSTAPAVGSAKINSTVASTAPTAGAVLPVASGAGPKSVAYKPGGTPTPAAPSPSAGGGPKSVASKPGAPTPAPAKPLTAQELAKIYG